jgi:hypothetical protein
MVLLYLLILFFGPYIFIKIWDIIVLILKYLIMGDNNELVDVINTNQLICEIEVEGLEEKDTIKGNSDSAWEDQDRQKEQRIRLWREFYGDSDKFDSDDETCSPLVPITPKTPLNLGGYRKLEDEEEDKSI